ncbi:MAG: DUF368 domain-containing protein [Erysipelotrichaceae bacterium]|jgi:putative membrane protein|nr:DUF368 domain-containing protein [Erysipelotrichaceae bacterium]
MKIKNFFLDLLKGTLIGVTVIIPGLSGGVIAIILNIYHKIIKAISELFKHFVRSFLTLLPLALGGVIGLVALWFPLKLAFEYCYIMIITLFVGFIIGSMPGIAMKIDRKTVRPRHFVFAIIAGVVAIGLGVISVAFKFDLSDYFDFATTIPVWIYFFLMAVGFITAFALISPGFSSSIFLIVLGVYTPLLGLADPLLASLQTWNAAVFFSILGMFLCFIVGLLVGCVVFAKFVNYLLAKHQNAFYFIIIGFVVSSIVSCYLNNEFISFVTRVGFRPWEIIVAVLLLGVGFMISFLMVLYEKRHPKETNESTEEKHELGV